MGKVPLTDLRYILSINALIDGTNGIDFGGTGNTM